MIFERIGRIFAPSNSVEKPEVATDKPLIEKPVADEANCSSIKGRSMVGYSRRGFLGMLASAAVASEIKKPEWLSEIRDRADAHVANLADGGYYDIKWPIKTRWHEFGVLCTETLEVFIPMQSPVGLSRGEYHVSETGVFTFNQADANKTVSISHNEYARRKCPATAALPWDHR